MIDAEVVNSLVLVLVLMLGIVNAVCVVSSELVIGS